MKRIDPTLICQIANPEVYLPCHETVDGLRCERLERHSDDHWLGEHTILHRIAGADHSCAEVEGIDETEPVEVAPAIEPATAEPAEPAQSGTPLSRKTSVGLIVGAVVLALLMAVGWQFLLSPAIHKGIEVASSGPITASNTQLVPFTGSSLSSANAQQKALGVTSDAATDPPAFIFNNGEASPDRRTIDLYLDFGDKESRDLILLNRSMLESLVESGKVELRIHAVPSGTAYSMYAPETLAEVFYAAPAEGWNSFIALLKFADENERQNYGFHTLAKKLAATVASDSTKGKIDAESIQNGTFSSWLLSISKDPRLAVGAKLPSMYLDDSAIALPSVDLASNSGFNKALQEQ